MKKTAKAKKTTTRVIAQGFALIILVGALLLTLPIATRTGEVNFLNALFTATSATCVTGLVVADTFQNWTIFGQIVIISLIQIGGLGFMTVGVYISILLKRRIRSLYPHQIKACIAECRYGMEYRIVNSLWDTKLRNKTCCKQ